MAVTADGVWAEDVLRSYVTSLYPAALRITRNTPDADLTMALRALPDRHRTVVFLADLEGLGYRQISALTGIPIGSVKSCLHRARSRLRAELGAYASRGRT